MSKTTNTKSELTQKPAKPEKPVKSKPSEKPQPSQKSEKPTALIIALIALILALIGVVLFLLFGRNDQVTILIDEGGDSSLAVDLKVGDLLEVPVAPVREGYVFGGWLDQRGHIVNTAITVDTDTTLTALWIPANQIVNSISFITDTEQAYQDIVFEHGKYFILPVAPVREGHNFVGWVTDQGEIYTSDTIIIANVKLYAKWVKADAATVTISFQTDGKNIYDLVVENGQVVAFPATPEKSGAVFAGWVDQNGNLIEPGTTFTEDMTFTASWTTPYTCPADCTVSADGKTCTKTRTAQKTTASGCPKDLVKGQCVDLSTKYHADNAEQPDGSYDWECRSNTEYMWSEIDESGLGAFVWCAKKVAKTSTSSCPAGYKDENGTCTKRETLNCTANQPKVYVVNWR